MARFAQALLTFKAVPMSSTLLQIPIDKSIQEQAANTLATMGLTIPDAVCAFLAHVIADKALPFATSPNQESRTAMQETDEIIQTRNFRFQTARALLDDLEENSRQ